MDSTSQAYLAIWHSRAFTYIVFTICGIIFLAFVRKIVREFIDCRKSCEVPKAAEQVATKTAGYIMNKSFANELKN